MPTGTLPRTALVHQLDPHSTSPVRLDHRKPKHVVGRAVVEGALADQVRQLEDRLYAVVVVGAGGEAAAFGYAVPFVREWCWWGGGAGSVLGGGDWKSEADAVG